MDRRRFGHMRLAGGQKTVHAGNITLRVVRCAPHDVLNGSPVARVVAR